MNPEWLRYYIALAETKSFQAAAGRVHVTPQAISRAVGLLEDQLGLVLVDRDHRVKGLTPAGFALLDEARAIVERLENAERRMGELRDGEPQGPVTLAGVGLWLYYLLPEVLAELATRYPRIEPRLYSMLPDELEPRLASGEVDVGLLPCPPRRPDLFGRPGPATRSVVVGRPQPACAWHELAWVTTDFFGQQVDGTADGWPEDRFPRRVVARAEMLESIIRLAEAGVGAAYLPELAVRDRLSRGTLAVLADPPCETVVQLYVITRKGVRPTPAIRAIAEALTAV